MSRRSFFKFRSGLGLAEALISLAITTALLTAVASAFQASAAAVSQNDEFFRATQSARVAMARLLTQIRRGAVDQPAATSAIRIITAGTPPTGGQDLTYQWNTTTKKLMMITNDDLTDPDYTLASNVTDVVFTAQMGKDYNNADCVTRIAVQIAVTVGKNQIRLSGSAAPRRNMTY